MADDTGMMRRDTRHSNRRLDQSREPVRVLIVDDDKDAASITGAILEQADCRCTMAGSGDEALRRLQDGSRFDLVLMDVVMRGMDGIALLDRVQFLHPQLPVIMITGLHDIGTAVSAMRKGAYDFLLKPVEGDHLLAAVRRALEHNVLGTPEMLSRQALEDLVKTRTEMLSSAIADLERSYDVTLEALGYALDMKDTETEGHSRRVTAYTIVLAKAMHLDPAQMRVITRGAFLHDIGKMAIPDAILSKPGKLNAQEQAVMREHCARGYEILKKIPFLDGAAEIVFSHQEHYDGSGYPHGLKQEEIPLGARIFAVADTLDAITSDRPYRKANTFGAAREEIKRCSGTQFDPAVVEVYLALPDKLWQDLRVEIDKARFMHPLSMQ